MPSSIAPPASFLSLAPTTSSTYPTVQASNNTTSTEIPDARTRRSSSLSSDASMSAKQRFLKLGPVFFGQGDGKGMGDWSDEVVSE